MGEYWLLTWHLISSLLLFPHIETKEHQRPEQEQFSLIWQTALGEGSSSLAHLSAVLNKPVVSEHKVSYFAGQTRLYWHARQDGLFPAPVLYTKVMKHQQEMSLLLARSLPFTSRLLLCETLSRTLLLAGVLLYDLGHYEQARAHYKVAWRQGSPDLLVNRRHVHFECFC